MGMATFDLFPINWIGAVASYLEMLIKQMNLIISPLIESFLFHFQTTAMTTRPFVFLIPLVLQLGESI